MTRYQPTKRLIDMVYPHKFLPGGTEAGAAAAWGGVVVFGALFMIQPWGWIKEQISPPKQES
eukprot:CAMPEP_0168621212 /NCGR_PEP_ID=MMETSP0449_2-20121227/7565_1 /TAXON_ID=1082188 /ORGANISM="Strombidium rassoulzadegani, Strain ras09" /LENGTH=61 /DNA_ID=CAMNT_0008662299 /DNA_START=1 /DNA_END=186 /DNA_ORIENTATION=-